MVTKARSVLAETAVIGVSCRFPGASSVDEFWNLLAEGRNSVRPRPSGRWSVERFLRIGEPEPGFTYTFAGGYIDNPFGFDPTAFGISPREAQQMDPQQRMLLELTWHALEDAGIPPLSIAGRNVGVYVGASMVDYQSGASHDPAVMESHFMTGNSLSILSNRISYAFDLHGPSFTLDSACSSSFVAVNQAMAALRDGEIEMAIVGGVNLLLSPAPFIGFSQARMLSPTGLSRPFSQDADGYVRSEGGVVLVLRRLDDAIDSADRIRSVLVGSASNSDGRTSGISLPSFDGQRRLIEDLYDGLSLDADRLAFVEAHGTGTKVGDPIEAQAIGNAIGQKRGAPLPIGSAKSNIGHLEAASGLAGLLKSILSLEKGVLPKSLFLDRINTSIDFESLNLVPNAAARDLDQRADAPIMAGVCNYGFGGTNAHVVLRKPSAAERAGTGAKRRHVVSAGNSGEPSLIFLSAASQPALQDKAAGVAKAIRESGVRDIAAALGHRQDFLKTHLALPVMNSGNAADILDAFAEGATDLPGLETGQTANSEAPVAFVFSGNGSQFGEMGKTAMASNPVFRREIDAIDALFEPMAGWSLAKAIEAGIPANELQKTSVAQPLIYAIQSALARTLRHYGIIPAAVLGHSVGEVAAAESAGALTRADAVRLIYERSRHQEAARGKGRMLVVAADADTVRTEILANGEMAIEIAATNSPTSTTVTGPAELLSAFSRYCRKRRIATVALDIDYPFHSSLLAPLRDAMIEDLGAIRPLNCDVPFISSVTGEVLSGSELDGTYWWNNVREPVRFDAAIERVTGLAAGVFVEIGPRAILQGPIGEVLRAISYPAEVVSSLSQKEEEGVDPVLATLARLVVAGAAINKNTVFGPPPAKTVCLPAYPFQRQNYNLPGTHEALLSYGRMWASGDRHPLLGSRMADGSPEWRNLIDVALVPYLSDHRVDGGVIVPAAGLIEMALAAGRELFGDKPLELDEFDVLKALAIADDEAREVSTRYFDATGTIEIWSRRRFSTQEWTLHARGSIALLHRAPPEPLAPPIPSETVLNTADEVYAEAIRAGLEYRPLFQLVTSSARDDVTTDAQLRAPEGGMGAFAEDHVVHPASLDASFHGLFISRPQKDGETKAHLPVRFRKICVWRQGATIRRSITLLTQETNRFKTVAINLFDDTGALAVSVEAAVLRAVYLAKATIDDRTFRDIPQHLARLDLFEVLRDRFAASSCDAASVPDAWLVARAFSVSLAHATLTSLLDKTGADNLRALRASEHVAPGARAYFDSLVAVLADFGALAEDNDDRPAATLALPAPESLLATLIERCPQANLEIRLAAIALGQASRILKTGDFVAANAHMQRRLEIDSLLSAGLVEEVAAGIEAVASAQARPLRVVALEPWGAAIDRICLPLVRRGLVELTLATHDRAVIDQHRAQNGIANIEYLLLDADRTEIAAARHDLLLHIASRPLLQDALPALRHVGDIVDDDAPALVVVPTADLYLDVLAGCLAGWLVPVEGTDASIRIPTLESTQATMRLIGVRDIEAGTQQHASGQLIVGRLSRSQQIASPPPAIAILEPGDDLPVTIGARLAALRFKASDLASIRGWADRGSDQPRATLVVPADGRDLSGTEELAARIERIKSILEALDGLDQPARVIVLTRDAQAIGKCSGRTDAGILGFVRVAINEFPGVDLRVLDLADELDDEAMADAILATARDLGNEREWLARADGLSVNRLRRGLEEEHRLGSSERSLLRFDQPGKLDSFEWVRTSRQPVSPGQVEIEVAAIGLNFRDVLVGLGILDDDLLGAGLTAASLGFECSGTVRAVGDNVAGLKIGDPVMGFAKDVFSSHIVAEAWQFFKVPEGVSLEAAATVPVAFATAWFALMDRARLRRGMDVLIHGGAGGVGLAAIQIAKRAGARVIATASSEERRAIALAAGADFAYDSRNERFAEAIARDFGGVDVVLNSLAGPAMVASFKLVKPFGCFIELGKRDYLDNSQLALRPFIRNIAYIGVDLDELLAHDKLLVQGMMSDLAGFLAVGQLRALPYQVYDAHEIGVAFRSMQASEHVGKIVIRPALQARRDYAAINFQAKDGVYVVVGGTSGLGFATACWLAEKGASTIVLASRRGRIEEGLEDRLEAMRAAGTSVLIEALDVSDEAAVRALIRKLSASHGPLKGIVHAAVLLDDGMISGLSPERLRAVLRPKLEGAINLEKATFDQPLDFFVVYSSATTVIGSPGQGAYVAANAFLEGFARARRAAGRPALAIGWGAIADVGIIARDKQLGQRLRRTTGVVGIKSSEGLAHLGRLLALGNAVGPIQFYTNIAPSAAAEKLALLSSPTFSGLALARREESGEEGDDLVTAIAGKTKAEALDIISQALRREVSHILRMPTDQIDIERPLGELGLDSLMALELALSIERLSGREVPMIGAGDRRLADIAATILNQIGGGDDAAGPEQDAGLARIVTMVQKHTTEDLSPEDVEALKGRLAARAS